MLVKLLTSDQAEDLIDNMPVEVDGTQCRVIQDKHVEPTRWGDRRELVFYDGSSYWSFRYEAPRGDGEWNPFDYAKEVEALRVKPRQVVSTIYEADFS